MVLSKELLPWVKLSLIKLHQAEQLATVFCTAMLAWHIPEWASPQPQLKSRRCIYTYVSQKYPKCSRDTWQQATYSTTRAGAPVEERTGNPYYFCFHLPQTREYIWMERITPGKLFIHLRKQRQKVSLANEVLNYQCRFGNSPHRLYKQISCI